MGRPLAKCGTKGAYRRHLNAHEPIDELCRAWKEADTADLAIKAKVAAENRPPRPPRKPNLTPGKITRKVDFVQETLRNLALVEKAMKNAGVDKIGPLSKRKSELLRELKEYQTDAATLEGGEAPQVDPVDEALGGVPDMSNVTRLGA